MKVLITGVSGFIGNYLAQKWLDSGIEIIGTTRNKHNVTLDCPLVIGDLSLGLNYSESVDFIVHTAAQSPKEGISLRDYISNNVDATKKIIEYAKKYNVKKIIYLSSISIYGEVLDTIIDENTSIINPGYYGMTKYIGESLLKESEGISCVALRLPGVLGKEAYNPWLVKATKKMLKNEKIEFYNPNSLFNNMVHVIDLEKFIQSLFLDNFTGFEKLTLGCKESLKINEIIFLLKKYLNSKSEIISNESDKISFTVSIEKALKRGYDPMLAKEIIELFCNEIM